MGDVGLPVEGAHGATRQSSSECRVSHCGVHTDPEVHCTPSTAIPLGTSLPLEVELHTERQLPCCPVLWSPLDSYLQSVRKAYPSADEECNDLNHGTGAVMGSRTAVSDGVPRAAISAPHGAHRPRGTCRQEPPYGRWLATATANTNITAPADVPVHTSGHIDGHIDLAAQAAAQ